MTETNVFQLSQPGTFADPLTDVLRNGARALLAQAVEAEAAAWLSAHANKLTDDGRQRLVPACAGLAGCNDAQQALNSGTAALVPGNSLRWGYLLDRTD